MTYQEIKKVVVQAINNLPDWKKDMYTEDLDEQHNQSHYSIDGAVEDIIESIEEDGHEENKWSEYPTLTKSELENIITQTI